jgi:MFS family permease
MERIMAQAHCGSNPSRRAAAHALAAGLAASLVGIGLSRFAYTPLVPALISAGWFTPADTAYLGAANLAGYLAGAHDWVLFGVGATAGPVLAGWLADRIGFGPAFRVALALQILGIAVPAMTGDGIVLAVS